MQDIRTDKKIVGIAALTAEKNRHDHACFFSVKINQICIRRKERN